LPRLAFIVKEPSAIVVVVVLVPITAMVAPKRGAPVFVLTTPVTFSWPVTELMVAKQAMMNAPKHL
jgi:hypothetical protein